MAVETKSINLNDGCDDTRHLLPRFRGDLAVGVKCWLRGVFEGGGAKGLAYRGALEAVEKQGCWFEAVAGSSAGAITAALIAAGYSPRELDEAMEALLRLLWIPNPWNVICRLRKNAEILPREAFREKLDSLLRRKASLLGFRLTDELTFEDLHNSTGVDLYVVAADISRQEPMVFNHLYTPRCQVTDAIMASSSIPFVFDGGMLTSNGSKLALDPKSSETIDRRAFRTIVDGGVWTNFPMFVFKDSAFLEYMSKMTGKAPVKQSEGPVVGFMLHELLGDSGGAADETTRQRLARADYTDAHFERGASSSYKLGPIEQTDLGVPPMARPGLQWLHGPDAPRWPRPKQESCRILLTVLDKIFLPASTWLALIFPVAFMFGELWLLIECIQWDWLRVGLTRGEFRGYLAITVMAVLYLIQLSIFGALFLSAWFGNWALLRPARRVLYGLFRTMIATPGTTPWEHLRPDVIALEIPRFLTTLKLPCKEKRDSVIELARAKTEKRLTEILKSFDTKDTAQLDELKRDSVAPKQNLCSHT